MGQVVALDKPIEKLILEIRGHVHDAGRAETTCAKHQLQAGWRLLALRERVESGEVGAVAWWEWFDANFTGHIKSHKYAEKLMRWARADDPEGAREAEKAQQREADRARRKRDAGSRARAKDESASDSQEYDIVEHALNLVGKMTIEERDQFDDAYRSKFQ